jgi:hypothetical protein
MESVKEIKKRLTFDIDQMLDKIMAMDSTQAEIISLNQEGQLSEGIDAKEQKIRTIASEEQGTEAYARQTIAERSKRGLQIDKVDLNFEGNFWKTFQVKKVRDGWEIIADWKKGKDDIRDNFPLQKFDFLGLTDVNLAFLVNDTILPELEKMIRAKLK